MPSHERGQVIAKSFLVKTEAVGELFEFRIRNILPASLRIQRPHARPFRGGGVIGAFKCCCLVQGCSQTENNVGKGRFDLFYQLFPCVQRSFPPAVAQLAATERQSACCNTIR
jgi:hypothetical protein